MIQIVYNIIRSAMYEQLATSNYVRYGSRLKTLYQHDVSVRIQDSSLCPLKGQRMSFDGAKLTRTLRVL